MDRQMDRPTYRDAKTHLEIIDTYLDCTMYIISPCMLMHIYSGKDAWTTSSWVFFVYFCATWNASSFDLIFNLIASETKHRHYIFCIEELLTSVGPGILRLTSFDCDFFLFLL